MPEESPLHRLGRQWTVEDFAKGREEIGEPAITQEWIADRFGRPGITDSDHDQRRKAVALRRALRSASDYLDQDDLRWLKDNPDADVYDWERWQSGEGMDEHVAQRKAEIEMRRKAYEQTMREHVAQRKAEIEMRRKAYEQTMREQP